MKAKAINYRLFLFEIVFACLIILCHIDFSNGDILIDSLGRSGVLFFFILSAYFYNFSLNREDYKYSSSVKRSIRLAIIGLVVILIYYAIFIPISFASKGTPGFFSNPTFNNLVDLINNYFPNIGFTWFIFALAVCYLLFPLINKIKWFHENKFSVLVPIGILVLVYTYRIIAIRYDLGIFSRFEVTRNFLFTGIPCFLIGTYIYDHIKTVKEVHSVVFYPVFVALFGVCVLEAFLHSLISNTPNEFYLASIPLSILTVVYCVQHEECKVGQGLYKVFGSTAYMFVYLFHVLFLRLFSGLLQFDFTRLLLIFIAVAIPLAMSAIFNLFKKLKQ